MKQFILACGVAIMFISIGCNRPIEWTDEMTAQFKTKCLDEMAAQFKAENPEEFCTCYVNKLKEKEMGMMDMVKESVKMAEDCGATLK